MQAMYRVAGVKRLFKNVYYPFTDDLGKEDGIIYWTNDAIEHARIVAKKIARSNENSTVLTVENDNDCIYHFKVTDGSAKTNIADIFVYPITVSADRENNYCENIFTYRSMNYKTKTHEVSASGFVFARANTLEEALMFIDSFLFACDLQQKDKEEK